MKVVKLKQMAKTLMYLEEKDYADYTELSNASESADARFYEVKTHIKASETRLAEIQILRTHIINYSKTRDVYKGYREAGYSKKYLAEHESDIILHKAAKKAFDELGVKKLPTKAELNGEYAKLISEKKAAYAEYHRARNEMKELLTVKANVDLILGVGSEAVKREGLQER